MARAFEISSKVDERNTMIMSDVYSVLMNIMGGRFERIMSHIEKARDLDKNGNFVNVILNAEALSYQNSCNYERGAQMHEEIISEIHEGDFRTLSISLVNLGFCYVNMGRFDEALKVTERAFELVSRSPNPAFLMAANENRGIAFAGLGKYDESIEAFNESLSFKSAGNFPFQTTRVQRYYGKMLLDNGRTEEARFMLFSSASMAKKVHRDEWIDDIDRLFVCIDRDEDISWWDPMPVFDWSATQ